MILMEKMQAKRGTLSYEVFGSKRYFMKSQFRFVTS